MNEAGSPQPHAPTVPASVVAVTPSGPLEGRLAAPASKSVTNRLLALAALASGESVLRRPLHSDDADAMRRVIEALGVQVRTGDDAWVVRGSGGRFRPAVPAANAGLAGTAMRFGVAMATLATDAFTVTGLPPLLRRPIGPLVDALRQLGAEAADREGYPPVRTSGGGLRGGPVCIDASRSSQFVSALLLVAPYAAADVRITAQRLAAPGYVALTAATMRDWGAEVAQDDAAQWTVRVGRAYEPRDVVVEYDASAACHLYGLAAATGGRVTVTNAAASTRQPDARFPELLAAMGAEVERDGDAVTVSRRAPLAPLRVDLESMPDQVTTLATLAALAEGESELRGVAVARGHETDRLAALATELRKLGVEVTELPDGLRIRGGHARGPARMATHDDHRLAMAFAALAAAVPGVEIDEPWCVTKTYPSFWEDVRGLGLDWRELG